MLQMLKVNKQIKYFFFFKEKLILTLIALNFPLKAALPAGH